MEDLLLPSEKVLARNNEECFDLVLVSSNRREIFDKLIGRRYELTTSDVNFKKQEEHCQIDFITTAKTVKSGTQLAVGEFSRASKSHENSRVNSTQTLMVQKSYPARLMVGGSDLQLKCEKISSDQYLLTIGHEHPKGAVATTARVLRGVKFNLADSVQDLNSKKSTLGIPQSEWLKSEGFESTSYELVVQ